MAEIFVEVAVAGFTQLPEQLFTYRVPAALAGQIGPGSPVKVPFGRRSLTGWAIRLTDRSAFPKTKDIEELLWPWPLLDADQLELAGWLSDNYLAFYCTCLETFFPTAWLGKKKILKELDQELPSEVQCSGRAGPKKTGQPAAAGPRLLQYSDETVLFSELGELLARTAAAERPALVLAPEINQLKRAVDELKPGPDRPLVYHSGLPVRQRLAAYFKVLGDGATGLVGGTRQALFLPWSELGLIIVHNEHDPAYRQPANPHYDAVEVAGRLARRFGCPLVLTSPAPSVRIWQQVRDKKIDRRIVGSAAGPVVELASPVKKAEKALSDWRERLTPVLASGGRAIFYLNRRGWAPVVYCPTCRRPLRCPDCRVNLSYDAQTGGGDCHHCGYQAAAPLKCPDCGQTKFHFLGLGTQRLAQLLGKSYPGVPVFRLDGDTAKKDQAVQKIGRGFEQAQPSILVSTALLGQVAARPEVDLLTVAEIDQVLAQPDWRGPERLWQELKELVTDWRPRKCLILTGQTQHHLFQALAGGRDETFYGPETEARRQLNYPPFAALAEVIVAGADPGRTKTAAQRLTDDWRRQIKDTAYAEAAPQVLGPVEAPLARIKGRQRWQIMVKAKTGAALRQLLRPVAFDRPPAGVRISIELI